jgi:glycosyltransferase involved in cell wall biosynthesis
MMWSQRAAQAMTIAQPDAGVLTSHGLASDRVMVVPNGVDLSARVKKGKPLGYPAKGKVVCFVGNMGYAPNEEGALWFIRSIWPKVKKAVPDAVLMAVGGTPRKGLQQYHNGTDLFVTGWVPQVEPYLIGAAVSIAPLRFAGGMQNKVALSMGLGVPVVATSAATGWLPDAGKSLVRVADDADAFAAKIVEVLQNPKKARTQAVKGKKFVAKNYPWKTAGQKLEKVLKQAINQ